MGKRPLSDSFRDAFAGIAYVLRTQRNMRIHTLAAALVLLLAAACGLTGSELLWILLAVSSVLVAEMLNTAIEKSIDLFTPDYHPGAAIAKNVAAGAVLAAAINAAAVGSVILGPRLLAWVRRLGELPR